MSTTIPAGCTVTQHYAVTYTKAQLAHKIACAEGEFRAFPTMGGRNRVSRLRAALKIRTINNWS